MLELLPHREICQKKGTCQKDPYITIFTVWIPCEARVPPVEIDVDFGSRIEIATPQQPHSIRYTVSTIKPSCSATYLKQTPIINKNKVLLLATGLIQAI